MKRYTVRALSFALALLLVVSLVPMARAQDYIVTYINYSLDPFDVNKMPFYQDKILYAPVSTIIANGALTYSFKTDSQIGESLTFVNADKRWMMFSDGAVTNISNRSPVPCKIIAKNGTFFLPLAVICDFFGFTFELLNGTWGTALLYDTEPSTLAPSTLNRFKGEVANEVEEILAEYLASTPTPSTATPTQRVTLPVVIPSERVTLTPDPTVTETPTPPPVEQKIIYLTIDDGPGSYTHDILDVLDTYNAKATFFLQGVHYKNNPSAIRRIAATGHGLALHSYSHEESQFYASPEAMLGELTTCNDLLRTIAFTGSRLVRTPYGSDPYFTKGASKYKPGQREAMNEAGFRYWDWNMDSNDWRYGTREGAAVANNIINMLKNHNFSTPAVILIHEKAFTAGYLPTVLDYIENIGGELRAITNTESPYNFQNDRT